MGGCFGTSRQRVTDVEYLTLDDVVSLIRVLKVGPIRDLGLLDAAIARPQSSAFGTDIYGSLELKAAALLQSLVRHHALVDGNKRIAWLATVVFVKINGYVCDLTDDEAFSLVMSVTTEDWDVRDIAPRLAVTLEQ